MKICDGSCVIGVVWGFTAMFGGVMRVLWYVGVMTVLWWCCGGVMGTLCRSYEMLCRCYEGIMGLYWGCYGDFMGVLWRCCGCVRRVLLAAMRGYGCVIRVS